MPEITIAIPVHNRAQIVGRTLDSVHAQTYRPLSVVLVDNNSTDDSYEVLCGWRESVQAPDFHVEVLRETTPGGAAARNAALAVVDTPWLMFFDSDDTMDLGHVARAMAAAQAHPEASIVGWPTHLVFLDGSSAVKPFAANRIIYHGIMQGTMATQRYMARTDLFRQAGGWNPSVMKWNDIELGVRLALLPDAKAVKVSGAPTVHVYQTAESITGLTYHAKAKESEHSLDVIYTDLTGRPEQCIVPLKMSVLAALYRREGHLEDARRLQHHALSLSPSPYRRALQRFAYHYTRLGLPGLATLLSPLYP